MTTVETTSSRGLTAIKSGFRRLRGHRSAGIGTVLTLTVLLVAVFGQNFIPYDPLEINIGKSLEAPSREHLLGTDDFGRDILSRIVVGCSVSIRVGAGVMLLSTLVGTYLGLVAGFIRKLDGPIMRIMDAIISFPSLILALAAVAVMGPAEINTILALGIVYIPSTARLVRASALTIREWTFVEAAKAQGAGDLRIMLFHILPNCIAPLLVQATYVFAMAIIGEATLSFLGAGPPPPTPSWGNMIADARVFLNRAPWFSLFPGLAIFFTTIGLNLMGDGMRDILDPRLNGES